MTTDEYDASVLPFRLIAYEVASCEERTAGGDTTAIQAAGDAAAATYDEAADTAQSAGLSIASAIAAGLAAAPSKTLA